MHFLKLYSHVLCFLKKTEPDFANRKPASHWLFSPDCPLQSLVSSHEKWE